MVVAEVIQEVVDNLGTLVDSHMVVVVACQCKALVVSHMVDVACQIQVLVVVANLDSRAVLVEDPSLVGVVLEEAERPLARLFVTL